MAMMTSPRCRCTNTKGRTLSLPSAILRHSTSISIRSGLAVGTKCFTASFFSWSLTRKTLEKVPSPTHWITSNVGQGFGKCSNKAFSLKQSCDGGTKACSFLGDDLDGYRRRWWVRTLLDGAALDDILLQTGDVHPAVVLVIVVVANF